MRTACESSNRATVLQRRELLARGLGVAAAWLAGGLGSGPVSAHRAHVTLTRVVPNVASGSWEFLHAIHFHDAAQALRRWEPSQGWQPTDARGQARLMLALERGFVWRDPSGQTLSPAPVGAELAGDSLRLYQEIRAPLTRGTFSVECHWMHELFANQRNVIQIELGPDPQRIDLDARTTLGRFTVG